MIWTSLALTYCLTAQISTDKGRPTLQQPQFSPRRASPAVPLDDGSASPSRPSEFPPAKSPSSSIYGKSTTEHFPKGDTGSGRPTMEAPAKSSHASEHAPEGGLRLAPVEGVRQRLRPPELLAEALSQPHEGNLAGQPLTLVEVLNRVADRQQQIVVTKAYWKLAAARAEYHFARDAHDRLSTITESQARQTAVESALAAARAAVEDAKLGVVRAQFELAEQMSLLTTEEPPLPVDRPHVGEYKTYFEEIYRGRTPPATARLVHNTLPLRRQAIDAHADAIRAASDALESAGDDYQRGGTHLATVASALDLLARQRRAFVTAVREYNQDIADYVFGFAPEGTSQAKLVSMLIKTDRPANGNDSIYSKPKGPLLETTAPEFGAPNDKTFRDDAPSESRPLEKSPPAGDSEAPRRYPSGTPHSTRKPPFESSASASGAGLYQALLDSAGPARAQKLAGLLHWERGLPKDHGQNISLADCLRRQNSSGRPGLISTYWKTRERAAYYQALADQAESLNTLRQIAIGLRDDPGGARVMLQLQAAYLSTKATKLDEEVALKVSEFELTRAAGGALDGVWLLASTPPHAGRYQLKSAELPAPLASSWRVQKLVATIPKLHSELEEQATAIVLADAARAAATADPRPTPGSVTETLQASDRQAAQTLAFLRTLTAYNLAIADYALAVLPPTVASDKLVGALVVAQEANVES